MATKKPDNGPTDSDRAALDEIVEEHQFRKRLNERRRAMLDGVASVSKWVVAAGLLVSIARDGVAWAWGFFTTKGP